MNSISLAAEDVYEVERIIKKKRHPVKGELYFVKWKNFPNSSNTWEPAQNFSQNLIEAFELRHKNKRQKTSTSKTLTATNPTSNQNNQSSNNNDPFESTSSASSTTSSSQSSSISQRLVVINPVGKHTLPIIKEVFYEPGLTKEPIIVTDVTTKNSTITISECQTKEGFFQQFN